MTVEDHINFNNLPDLDDIEALQEWIERFGFSWTKFMEGLPENYPTLSLPPISIGPTMPLMDSILVDPAFGDCEPRLQGKHFSYPSGRRASRVLVKLAEYGEYLDRQGISRGGRSG